MRTSLRSRLALWLCAGLLLLCWCQSLRAAGELSRLGASLGLRYGESGGGSPRQWEEAAQKAEADFPGWALWSKKAGEQLENPRRLTSAFSEMLVFSGDGELVLPHKWYAGSAPAGNDTGGCALSEETALALFGSAEAVGNQLTWKGRAYTVRGVFRGDGPALFPVPEEERDAALQNVELALPGGTPDDARQLLSRWGLPQPEAVADAPLAARAASLLVLLPGWVLLAAGAARLVKKARRARGTPGFPAALLAVPGFLAAALWVGNASFELPSRFIPSRWADLGFWERTAQGIFDGFAALFARVPADRELALVASGFACLATSAAALVLAGLLPRRVRVRTGGELFFACAGSLLLTFFFLWRLPGIDAVRGLWLAIPALFAADWYARARRPRPAPRRENPSASAEAGRAAHSPIQNERRGDSLETIPQGGAELPVSPVDPVALPRA